MQFLTNSIHTKQPVPGSSTWSQQWIPGRAGEEEQKKAQRPLQTAGWKKTERNKLLNRSQPKQQNQNGSQTLSPYLEKPVSPSVRSRMMGWNILIDQAGCQAMSVPSTSPSPLPRTCGQSSERPRLPKSQDTSELFRALCSNSTTPASYLKKNTNSVPGCYFPVLKLNPNSSRASYGK